jgi:DNA-directed RNA polymerase specialized sigma24 family protein
MQPPQDSARSGSFATTPWTTLFRLRHASRLSKAQEALSCLCEIYWRPIFNHIGRHGYEFYDAQDLTQRFFVYLLEPNAFAKADRAKGNFRSYVLAALNYFLSHVRRDSRAQKRGGGASALPLDETIIETIGAPNEGRRGSPSTFAADRAWAVAIHQLALDRLADAYARVKASRLYQLLLPYLSGDKERGAYEETARRLGRSVATVRSDVARLRARYRELVAEELRAQDPDADLGDELREFCRLLAAED